MVRGEQEALRSANHVYPFRLQQAKFAYPVLKPQEEPPL